MSAPAPIDPALLETPSERSYTRAVVLSSVFGLVGLQHFYLGRHAEGLLDVGLTAGWIYCFFSGALLWAVLFLALDIAHTLVTTIRLLVGSQHDGEGRRVTYPGQRLRPAIIH